MYITSYFDWFSTQAYLRALVYPTRRKLLSGKVGFCASINTFYEIHPINHVQFFMLVSVWPGVNGDKSPYLVTLAGLKKQKDKSHFWIFFNYHKIDRKLCLNKKLNWFLYVIIFQELRQMLKFSKINHSFTKGLKKLSFSLFWIWNGKQR